MWIGPGLDSEDLPRLRRAGVRAILSLEQPGDDITPAGLERIRAACALRPAIAHRNVAIRDYDPEDLVRRLPEALAALGELHATRRVVYLHCSEGVNRAPSVALGYVVLTLGEPLDEALARLRTVHPFARPYDAFVDWLRAQVAR